MDSVDIYSDLKSNALDNSVEELQHENRKLESHINSLERGMEVLQDKVAGMRKIQGNLATNISELYKTAKAEIDRKDRTIAELRSQLDDVLFRRKNEKRTLNSPIEEAPKKMKPNEASNENYDRQRMGGYRRGDFRNREWNNRNRRDFNRNKFSYENRDSRRFVSNTYSNRHEMMPHYRKSDGFSEYSDIECVKLPITDDEDVRGEKRDNFQQKYTNKIEMNARNQHTTKNTFDHYTESVEKVENRNRDESVKEMGEISDEDEWFEVKSNQVDWRKDPNDKSTKSSKDRKSEEKSKDAENVKKKSKKPKEISEAEKAKTKKITVKEYLENNKPKETKSEDVDKKSNVELESKKEIKSLEKYKIPKRRDSVQIENTPNENKTDRVHILQVVSINPNQEMNFNKQTDEKYPEMFKKCLLSPNLVESKKRVSKTPKRKSTDSIIVPEHESGRVLRSATRKTEQEDEKKPTENKNELKSDEKILVTLPRIFNDNLLTVDLSHDGAIPVLHVSDKESNDNSLNLSSYLPKNPENVSTDTNPVTSTPLKPTDFELLKADLQTSLSEQSSESANFSNCLKTIQKCEETNTIAEQQTSNEMEAVIREGLRLHSSEASCDVILSCRGHRLMAHRLILSIASPILKELLMQDTTEPSVVIFPDIDSNTMSQILDYIYTGTVIIYSKTITDFINAANLLQIHIDWEYLDNISFHKTEHKPDIFSRKTQKKLPNLLPITKTSSARKLCNYVIPSPWCPREQPVLEDPRLDCVTTLSTAVRGKPENDPNNNNSQLPCRTFPGLQSYQNSTSPTELDLTYLPQKNKVDEENDLKKQKPFKCEDCGKCFSQLRNYKYHRSIHEGTKEFAAKCPECGKVFNDRGYLSSHMKIHRDRKEYACPHCPKRFNQRVAYNMHLRIHTGIKPHECPTCGKSFSRKMLLKQHQRVHTGERPYSCPECGKTFADRSNMSLHARLHTGVKPYSCNLCPKSFTKKHHLKTHMNFHTGLKPYTCQKCGLAFSQSSNMRTHYKKCILKSNVEKDNTESNSSM